MVEEVRTIQTTEVPAWLRAYQEDILARAKALSRDTVAMPAYQVAERTPLQQQATNLATQGVGAYYPMLQAAAGTVGSGVQTLEQGAGMLQQGMGALGRAEGMIPTNAQAFDPSGIAAFMNPYEDAAVQQALADIARQGDIAGQTVRAQAVGSGAYGGARQAVAEQELGRNVLDQMGRTSAQMRMAGYESAASRAQSAFETAQGRQMQGAQVLGGLGTSYGTMGQGLGSLGQGMTAAGLRQAQLGEAYQGLNMNDVNLLSSVGAQEQAQRQAIYDASRMTQAQNIMQPYQQLGFYSDIFQGMPSAQTSMTTTQQPSPNMLSQLGGLGMGLYSLSQYQQ